MADKQTPLAGVLLALSATSAVAQAYTAMFAVQAAQQDNKMREEACQAGKPPNPDMAADFEKASEARLEEYFRLVGGNSRRAVAHLFFNGSDRARWTGPDGTQPVDAVADPIGAMRPYGTLTRKSFVVSNDAQSGRGVWVLTISNPADPSKTGTTEYGVDFAAGNWAGVWLWHMHLYRAPDTAPPPPDKFCHIAPDVAY